MVGLSEGGCSLDATPHVSYDRVKVGAQWGGSSWKKAKSQDVDDLFGIRNKPLASEFCFTSRDKLLFRDKALFPFPSNDQHVENSSGKSHWETLYWLLQRFPWTSVWRNEKTYYMSWCF